MAASEDDKREDGEPTTGEPLSDEIARKYDPERLLGMVSKRAGRGESLDHHIRQKFEKRWKMDLGHVRIYTGEFADEFNKSRGAHAVTVGATGMILMRGGADRSLGSRQGQALLAHEVTHVAQQRRGLFNRDATLAKEYTGEDERQAHAEEDRVADGGDIGGGSTNAAAEDMRSARNAEQDMKETLEKIRDRVFEMASDAQRLDWLRNNLSRRP